MFATCPLKVGCPAERRRSISSAVRRFDHDHFFSQEGAVTTMRDAFDYESPLGILGRLADLVVLERYMRRLLVTRNDVIKRAAETETWRRHIRGS